ncbi:XRE family transcriptional regulator [Amphibacillus sp. Q70]|uniref:XRE family transcriptional regulator n=1 Tax=Amphibacillus sp. Q70 TaxID=3453416 RepID=UPI003F84F4FA
MARGELTPIEEFSKKFFSNRLNQLLIKQNKKQVDLHKATQIPRSTLTGYVKGETLPKPGNVQKIADFFNVAKSDIDPRFSESYPDNLSDLYYVYNQLEHSRQQKVYRYAKNQLDEQNNIVEFTTREKQQSYTVDCYGAVSAGTGEWLGREQIVEVDYYGEVPEHDFAVTVNGDSMLPMFEDGQLIFVNRTHEARSGQVIIAQLNGESYVKKLVINSDGYRLVSLNKDYDDIVLKETDNFNIFGVVVL